MLKTTIESLTQKFTAEVLQTLRSMPLDQLMETMTPTPPRKAAADPTSQILALLQSHSKGFRAEEIKAQLSLTPVQTARALKRMLAEGSVTKRGQRRSTVYKVK